MQKANFNKAKKIDGFTLSIIIVCILTVFINSFVVQMAKVNGESMMPTLEENELLLVSKISKINNNFERGDIVIFKYNGRYLIKRLIGLPNETVQIIDNDIYINDTKIKDYVDIQMDDTGLLSNKIQLKDDEYIFLGDNRNYSFDSRGFGVINEKDIVGKIIFRFFPTKTF